MSTVENPITAKYDHYRFLLLAMRDLKIGRIVLQRCSSGDQRCSHNVEDGESSGSHQFKAGNCVDSNLATICRPEGLGSHAISVKLLGADDVEFDVKSVTIYTPPVHVRGNTPLVDDIKVGK